LKLPNGERALIDSRKLTDYTLDPEHDEGRHKAHLFEVLLGINRQNGELLLDAVRKAAVSGDAVTGKTERIWTTVRDRSLLRGPVAPRRYDRHGLFAMMKISHGW
jgi:hypothetical protein